jgi:MoaA/NifB/PqqE/SkfB family radical SAM enzyme
MWKRGDQKNEMNLDGWKNTVDMCYEVGVRYIEIFGGDALLRKDILVPLSEYIKNKYPEISIDLTTNCNIMDKETAEGLAEAGMDDIFISMDGVNDIHDEVRGREGTFNRVNQGIDWLLEARGQYPCPILHANCTISKHNIHFFENILTFAEKKGLDALHLEYVGEFWPETLDKSKLDGIKPTPYFSRLGNETCLVNEKEAYLIKEKVEKMKRESENMRVRFYTENIDKLTIENMVNGCFDNKRCYILRFKVTVDPSGFILGCPFFDGWKMGNINDQHLKSIWKNQKHMKIINAFKNGDFQFCKYCVLGVQRNPTLIQDMRDELNAFLGRVRI